MASGISRSTEKVVFAKYRENRMECEKGSWEKREMLSQKGILPKPMYNPSCRNWKKELGGAPDLSENGTRLVTLYERRIEALQRRKAQRTKDDDDGR